MLEAPSPNSTGSSTGNSADSRAAPRTQLMLRSAKVVCQSGEYLCTVRDVSTAGTGLRFLHEVPPERRILLELANTLTYPIERVWSGKQQAGYRFGCAVSLDEFVHEPSPYASRPIRLRIRADARIALGRALHRCELVDISSTGATVTSPVHLPHAALVGFEVPGLPPRFGHVCWQSGDSFGINFQRPLSTEELAHGAVRLQPFAEAAPRVTRLRHILARARAA